MPVGLWGLQSRIARAPPAKAASMPTRSSSQPASLSTSGTRSTTAPASGTHSKNGGYTGGVTITRSPGSVTCRSSSTTPIMTSHVVRIRAGSTVQPKRRCANAAYA